jgi:hypothetical protein
MEDELEAERSMDPSSQAPVNDSPELAGWSHEITGVVPTEGSGLNRDLDDVGQKLDRFLDHALIGVENEPSYGLNTPGEPERHPMLSQTPLGS